MKWSLLCWIFVTVQLLLLDKFQHVHAADWSATQSQKIHPVLVGKDHNSLLEIKIESAEKSVFLHSFTLSLSGCDDLKEIESLQVFSTGETQNEDTTFRFGAAVRPAKTVVISGNIRLRQGTNFFWISCRLHPQANLDHQVDAHCTHIRTSQGELQPSDETPEVRKRIGWALRQHGDDGVHTYRIPALATTPQGTLLCVYDVRRRAGRDLQEDIDIGLLRSTDGGQNWESQQIIMDMHEYGGLPQEENGCSDPGIVVDPKTGEVFVAAVWTNGRPGTHQWNKGGSEAGFGIDQTAQFLMVRSQDDGKTWSTPKNLTRQLKQENWILFAPSPQQGIALPDGTLIMPSQGRDAQDRHFSNLMISRDHGNTWKLSAPASFENTECQAVLLGDGSIMLNCRTEHSTKFRTVAITQDLGRSWTAHPTNRQTLIEPSCNGSTYRFDYVQGGEKKHLLVFANPYSQTGRENHTLRFSFDDGMTWPREHHLLLDVGRGAGYPSLSRVGENHIGIAYEGSQSHIVFQRIDLLEHLGL